MGHSTKICFMGYGKLTEMARCVIDQMEWARGNVLLVDTKVDGLHASIDDAIGKGCQVFIAGSANAAEFRRYSGAMLIELKMRPLDYAIAIRKVLAQGKRPVVVSYYLSKTINPDEIFSLFDQTVESIEYRNDEELLAKLERSRADVVIGASRSSEIAQQMGKEYILIYPGETVVSDALRRARSVAHALQREQRNNKLTNAIISESWTGIVGFSENRDVLVVNEAAQRFTGLSAEQIRRTKLRWFLSDADFQRLLETEQKTSFLVQHTGSQVLRMQLTKLEKDGEMEGALLLIDDGSENQGGELSQPNVLPFVELPTFQEMICFSPAMKNAVKKAKHYGGRGDMPLLISGEYGVGKQLFAQCIHSFNHSDLGSYVALNCAAIRENEETHFFGGIHDENGVAGQGIVDLSTTRTLVLENIWEASQRFQSCLLWAIDGIGDCIYSNRIDSIRARFSLITIVPDEKRALCRERLRPELLQKLETLEIALPPMEARTEDIVALFALWMKNAPGISHVGSRSVESLRLVLTSYSWPGNLGELRAVCHRYALAISTASKLTAAGKQRILIDSIGEDKLFQDILRRQKITAPLGELEGESLARLVEELKAVLLYGNDQVAARLGMSRTSMWRRLRNSGENK